MAKKRVSLEEREKELLLRESELSKKSQAWAEQDLIIQREYNELQMQREQLEIENQKLEEGKQYATELCVQLQEESEAISKFKETVNTTKQALENMRADIDNKETILNDERIRLDEAKKELVLRQQQIEGLRYQYLKDQNVTEASRKLIMSFARHDNRRVTREIYEAPEEQLYREVPVTINERYLSEPIKTEGGFKASDFIHEINTEVNIYHNLIV